MFDFSKKKQPAFGVVSADDDKDIEVHQVKAASRQGIWIEVFKLIRDVIFVWAVFMLLLVFVAQPVVVEGTSMLPTLHEGERLVVNKLIYYKIQGFSWGHIERGDVVVFWYPRDPDKSYVKRVIGLPGDTVELRNGVVFVNGQPMHEFYLDSTYNQAGGNLQAKKVDEHYYFVMGDNRDNSSDSRYWGLVPEKYIYGKVFFRFWMPSNIGKITRGDYELNEENPNDTRAGTDSR
ncbi:MAG: signal peptidase I [Pyrinomonadaceae bacterium]|nr:signal peptidase I [Pyrinomonadaceae bacterium]